MTLRRRLAKKPTGRTTKRRNAAKSAKKPAPKKARRSRSLKPLTKGRAAGAKSRLHAKKANPARTSDPRHGRAVPDTHVGNMVDTPLDVIVVTGFMVVEENGGGVIRTEVIDLSQPVDVALEVPDGLAVIDGYSGISLGAAIMAIVEEWEEADQARAVVQTADAQLRWERIREIYDHPDFPVSGAI